MIRRMVLASERVHMVSSADCNFYVSIVPRWELLRCAINLYGMQAYDMFIGHRTSVSRKLDCVGSMWREHVQRQLPVFMRNVTKNQIS